MRKSRKESAITTSRRDFLKGAAGLGAALALPAIVPASVFGQNAPSNRITLGVIGVGRMGMSNVNDIIGAADVRIVAVCDLDSIRVASAQGEVDRRYDDAGGCKGYDDYRELIARDDIDSVMISTPDHWHALPCVAAAKAGKDIFLEKPLSLTVDEGRIMTDAVRKHGRVFQLGSFQRSDVRFRQACELAVNGKIGEIKHVKVGFGLDPGCGPEPAMPIPSNLNYDMWLGQSPWAEYTEARVHPQGRGDRPDFGRPGWLRLRDYGHGMITGWGSHHLDILQWGLGMDRTGPVAVEGWGNYPKDGLWDVHTNFSIDYTYANGITASVTGNEVNAQGIRFEGTEGWVYVRRGFIDAHPKSLLTASPGPGDIALYRSNNHKRNWIDCIKTRSETITPIDVGHRSNTLCLIGSIAMELQRPLKWNPDTEQFEGDDEANRMLSRPMRAPWTLA